MNPKYSVVIPVYNRPDEVDELLQSLCGQTYQNFEVVVVEDGSAIPCKQVVKKYTEMLDVHYFEKPNSGPGQTRNYAAERSRGEYLLILDSDCILLEKLFQVRTTLMPYPGFRKQTATVTSFKNTDTEIYVFAKTHRRESTQCLVHLGTDSHVKTARIEFVHFFLAAPDASRGKERSHGIINSFLYIRKRIVCPVGTSKRICRFPLEFRFHRSQVRFRQDTV
jgi:glycosyltransferase involved in cell wall biosynthesis